MRMQVNREIGDREEETFVRIQSLIARRARRLVTLALGFGLLAIVAVGARWLWLRAAIEENAKGLRTALVCKSLLVKAHTVMAEGGVAAALGNVYPEVN